MRPSAGSAHDVTASQEDDDAGRRWRRALMLPVASTMSRSDMPPPEDFFDPSQARTTIQVNRELGLK